MSRKLQHLPIYTLDDRNRIIDISLLVFPHDNSEEEYEKLPDLVKKSDMGNGDYVGCKNGHITLWMPVPLHYKENNLTRIMTHYSRDRGVFVENGFHLYLNPPPQSEDERSFRTRLGEVSTTSDRSTPCHMQRRAIWNRFWMSCLKKMLRKCRGKTNQIYSGLPTILK